MRPDPRPIEPAGANPAPVELPHLEAAFAEETARLLRSRVVLLSALYLVFVGAAALLEISAHPERTRAAALLYAFEAAAAGVGIVAVRRSRSPGAALTAATALATVLALFIIAYGALTGLRADALAMAILCHLTGLVVLLPWGGVPQGIVGIASLVAFAVVQPLLSETQFILYAELAITTAMTTSIIGARWLRHHRHEAFVRAAQLAHATAAERDKSEILSGLLHVGDALSRQIGSESLLAEVNRLATQVIGCDWSSTFIYDAERRAFRLMSTFGPRSDIVEELQRIEFARDGIPLLRALEPGVILEIQDAGAQSLVPLEMMRRLETASALYAPIAVGDEIAGVLVNGYRQRTGPFTEKEKRLTLGIGNAIAVALENQRLIADLKAANRLKSEFVSTMSHELRTPLNVITGFSELLSDGTFGALNPDQQDAVARIRRSSAQLFELVTATLDLSRLEAGRDTVAVERIDLDRFFAELQRDVEVRTRGRAPQMRWSNRLAGRTIYSDRAKLKTILRNLINNAVKFTPSGAVEVRAHYENGAIVCSVIDTGVGIQPEHLGTIFEMFRQLDASSTREFEGVGLGLFIVKSLTEVMGGEVEVQSTVKVGSTFTVRIPAHIEAAPELRAPSNPT